MTSLPRFVSNRASQRVFYLGGHHLTVYDWRRGEPVGSSFFPADDQGLADFSRYLADTREVPAFFLVDVVEEEYRRDTLPHVYGRDRQQLIQHRSARLFRETPYWHVVFQGRERDGRRDDRVLYTAVSSPGLLRPWLALVQEHRVPLGGIYSLPLLSRALLPMLAAERGNALVVSLQSAGGLRQSFFQDGQLKLSRLAHQPVAEGPGLTDAIVDEVEKLRRYLNSLRLVRREEGVDVYLLVNPDALEGARDAFADTALTRYHIVDCAALAQRLGMEWPASLGFADGLFALMLIRARPRNHYGSPTDIRHYTLWRARLAMLAASMLMVVGSVVWSTVMVAQGISYHEGSQYARREAAFYRARYQQARAALPPSPLDPDELKAVVEAADRLTRDRPFPSQAMRVLSEALASYPELRVDRLEWRADAAGEGFKAQARAGRPRRPEARHGGRAGRAQLAVVRGRISPFEGDYRRALQRVKAFAEDLRGRPSVLDVAILTLPLDVGPGGSLTGDASASGDVKQADFALRLVVTDEPATN
jgi:hypothetical protein